MKIRYTGTKEVKKVNWGSEILVFDPICDLNEYLQMDFIEWLLHWDRKGLFVKDEDVEVEPEKPTTPEEEAAKENVADADSAKREGTPIDQGQKTTVQPKRTKRKKVTDGDSTG